jgi:hypothetical protein
LVVESVVDGDGDGASMECGDDEIIGKKEMRGNSSLEVQEESVEEFEESFTRMGKLGGLGIEMLCDECFEKYGMYRSNLKMLVGPRDFHGFHCLSM